MPKSKKTNHSSKTNGSPLREIAVSAGWGLAVIALLLVLLSLLLCSRDIPAGMTLPLVTVALAAGTLLAGYRCGRRLRQNGIIRKLHKGMDYDLSVHYHINIILLHIKKMCGFNNFKPFISH